MTTLRRILRYAPLAATLLLLLPWVDSVFQMRVLHVLTPSRLGSLKLINVNGWLGYSYSTRTEPLPLSSSYSTGIYHLGRDGPINAQSAIGRIVIERIPAPHPRNNFQIGIPYLLLITAMLPLAIGAFTGFQFSLRSWLAYMTLVSVEMAYFLPNASWRWFW